MNYDLISREALKAVIEEKATFIDGDSVYKIINLIDNAPTVLTIPENPTNGDIIKALFPSIEIYDSEKMESVYTGIPFGKYIGANVDCMRDWWNAPYKENEK